MIGRTILHYRVIEKLGQGGMGVVYRAEDTRLGRQVALKALAPEFARDAERRERLRQEARAAATIAHPGIATVYALEEAGDDLYIASEYVEGRTLRAELEAVRVSIEQMLDTAAALASALAAAHACGVVHRDLKPENIIRGRDGAVKILDFGLARFDEPAGGTSMTRLTAAGTAVGTVAYMSPEQLEGLEVDPRSDVFAFGLVLYEMATGQHPFEGSSAASITAKTLTLDPPSIAALNPRSPAELDRIVRKCLRKNRQERYQSTGDLAVDLDQLRREFRDGRSSDSPVTPEITAERGGFRPAAAAPEAAVRFGPRWWWRFHQIWVAINYALFGGVAWLVTGGAPKPWGLALFFGIAACATAGFNLRAHLLFTERFNPQQVSAELKRAGPWIRRIDWVFAALLFTMAGLVAREHNWWALLFGSVAVGWAVASLFLEPATTRAAFRRKSSGQRSVRRKVEGRG